MKGKKPTIDDLNFIGKNWETTEKIFVRRLQRIYNNTKQREGEKSKNCLCNREKINLFMQEFRLWALENNYFEYE